MGLRYRVQIRVPGTRRTIDLAFSGPRLAVDVRGCFWHGCDVHGTSPAANADWWRKKLQSNKARDADTERRLREAGWHCVVVWEHEPPDLAAERVAAAVAARRGRPSGVGHTGTDHGQTETQLNSEPADY